MCARTGRQRSKPPRTVHGWTTLVGTRDGMDAACVSIVSPAAVQPTARGARATAAESGLKSGWQETMTPAVASGSESNNRGPWFIFRKYYTTQCVLALKKTHEFFNTENTQRACTRLSSVRQRRPFVTRHLATLYSRWSLLISGPMDSEGRWASGADVCFRLTSGPCLCLALHAAADGTKVGIDQHALTELLGGRFIFCLGSGIVLPVASEHCRVRSR